MPLPEAPPPDESHQPKDQQPWALLASQDEIDVRFGWIADELQLEQLERAVLGESLNRHRWREIGGAAINFILAGAASLKGLSG